MHVDTHIPGSTFIRRSIKVCHRKPGIKKRKIGPENTHFGHIQAPEDSGWGVNLPRNAFILNGSMTRLHVDPPRCWKLGPFLAGLIDGADSARIRYGDTSDVIGLPRIFLVGKVLGFVSL
jgi:hypothetical protein